MRTDYELRLIIVTSSSAEGIDFFRFRFRFGFHSVASGSISASIASASNCGGPATNPPSLLEGAPFFVRFSLFLRVTVSQVTLR